MEETTSELDFLAQATFELTAAAKQLRDPFAEFKEPEKAAPNSPGIFYRVDQGLSTFCLRAIASDNLFDLEEKIKSEDPSTLKKLKVETDPLEGLYFFETESLALAEVIVDQLANRRFPIQEELLCNLSDPGFSWWMNQSSEGFDIYFSSHGVDRSKDFVRLGPLGDPSIAYLRLNSAGALIRHSFPIRELSCSEKIFSLKAVGKTHLNYQIFKNIFLKGENPTREEAFQAHPDGRTLYYYFKEIATLRRFWLILEERITFQNRANQSALN